MYFECEPVGPAVRSSRAALSALVALQSKIAHLSSLNAELQKKIDSQSAEARDIRWSAEKREHEQSMTIKTLQQDLERIVKNRDELSVKLVANQRRMKLDISRREAIRNAIKNAHEDKRHLLDIHDQLSAQLHEATRQAQKELIERRRIEQSAEEERKQHRKRSDELVSQHAALTSRQSSEIQRLGKLLDSKDELIQNAERERDRCTADLAKLHDFAQSLLSINTSLVQELDRKL